VAGIAALAFYTSFEAIKAFATRSDGIAPEHAWAVPLLVDSFIVVATAADLWFVTIRRDRAWWEVIWPKALLASAASVSFVLNIAHAEPTLAARGVAAIPPAALVLGVELLMMVLRRATQLRATRVQLAYEAAFAGRETPGPRAAVSLHRTDPAQVEAGRDAGKTVRTAAVAELPPAHADEAGREPAGADAAPVRPPAEVELRDEELSPRTAPPVGGPRRPVTADYPAVRRTAYRILFERAPGEVASPEALQAALAARGIRADLATAGRLLRDFDGPVGGRRRDETRIAERLRLTLSRHDIAVELRVARRLLRDLDESAERGPAGARTPDTLRRILAAQGITVGLGTAAALLRDIGPPRRERPGPASTGEAVPSS
jgi:hypothetical protein